VTTSTPTAAPVIGQNAVTPGTAATATSGTSSTGSTGSTASTGSTGSTGSAAKTTGADGFGMDKDAFLRILVEQLRHQDPSSPGDSEQYIQQMTQYSMLEQLTNISEASQNQQTDNAAKTAIGLVGHTVTYVDKDPDDPTKLVDKTGVVESVKFGADGATLTVGGHAGVSIGLIKEVR
jgi:flagellar basal-body rod modification protein FlgD